MAGLLDVSSILSQFAPTPQQQADARRNAILQASFALLGGRRGSELQSIGQAGLLGMKVYQDQLAQQQQQIAQRMQEATQAASLTQTLRKMQDYDAAAKIAAQQAQGGVGPSGTSVAPSASPAPASQAGGAFPSIPGGASGAFNVAAGFPTAGNSPTPMPTAGGPIGGTPGGAVSSGPTPKQTSGLGSKRALAAQYLRTAQALQNAGILDYAQAYTKAGIDMMPKLKGQEVRVDPTTGQRVMVNVYDDGSTELAPFSPDRPPLHFADNGAFVGIGQDPFTGAVVNQGVRAEMTPGQVAQNQLGLQQLAEAARAHTLENARGVQANALTAQSNQLRAEQNAMQNELGMARYKLDAHKQEQADQKVADAAQLAQEQGTSTVDRMQAMIDQAKPLINGYTTGIRGAFNSKVPGHPAYRLRSIIESLKSNIALQQLQDLRKASPTGSALGRITNMEVTLLANSLGNLDPNQGEAQLRGQLAQIDIRMQHVKQLLAAEKAQQGGAAAPAPQALDFQSLLPGAK